MNEFVQNNVLKIEV